jgi:hypothetical protein
MPFLSKICSLRTLVQSTGRFEKSVPDTDKNRPDPLVNKIYEVQDKAVFIIDKERVL